MVRPDPRGPLVSVTEVHPGQCDGNFYVLMCGHVAATPARIMNNVGDLMRCYSCGRTDLKNWEMELP